MNKKHQNAGALVKNSTLPACYPFRSNEAKEEFLKSYNELAEQWPVPSETVMIDTPYGNTFVKISGSADAPPLVLLHPGGSNSLSWIPHVELFSGHFRIYAIDDLYGHGLSVLTGAIHGPDDYMKWLTGVFDTLNPGSGINLLGMSWGGGQTFHYALRYPERLSKIIMLAPAAGVLPVSPLFIMRILPTLLPGDYFNKKLLSWMFEDYLKKDKAEAERGIEMILSGNRFFKPQRLPGLPTLTDNELAGIAVPALYIVGENEKVYSPQKALQRLHTIAPQIQTELIPGAGHDLLAVQPELIHKIILKFLKHS